MKSLSDVLMPVKNALLSVTDNVGLYEAVDATITHSIYAPDGEAGNLPLNNIKTGQIIQGTIDLFALNKDRQMADQIQQALNEAGVSFYLNSTQFENLEKNDFIHYEWVFEVS